MSIDIEREAFEAWCKREYEPRMGEDWRCVMYQVNHGDKAYASFQAGAAWQRTQSAPVSKAERLPLENLEFVKRPVPSGWAVKRSDASRHELYGFYDEYLGPLDGWLQDPRRAVLFGNKEAAIAAQAALSVDSKLAISVVWLVYDPVFDTYREQAQ